MTLHGVDLKQGEAKQALEAMPAESIQTCVTSPPYWGLRDYGVDGQLGLEPTPDAYVDRLVASSRRCGGCCETTGRCG